VSDGPARIVGALRSAGADSCSGEALSKLLRVSRSQIWKHVETLRRRGYRIEGAPGGGYRMLGTPDRLYPEEIQAGLETRWLARRIEYFDETDSTNRVALELGRGGAPHGTTVVAEAQSAGRGRLGRAFFSPPYLNLYTSVLLRPLLSTAEAPTLVHAAAVAVADAIAAETADDDAVEIKWPNDVLLNGRKSTGILLELAAEAARVEYAVVGIGVNLNVEPDAFPEEFRAHATSLRAHVGRPIGRPGFARRLYGTLESVLDDHARGGLAALRDRYEARFRMRGRSVRVIETAGEGFAGVARGISEDGALLVERANGQVRRVLAGDVTLAKETGAS